MLLFLETGTKSPLFCLHGSCALTDLSWPCVYVWAKGTLLYIKQVWKGPLTIVWLCRALSSCLSLCFLNRSFYVFMRTRAHVEVGHNSRSWSWRSHSGLAAGTVTCRAICCAVRQSHTERRVWCCLKTICWLFTHFLTTVCAERKLSNGMITWDCAVYSWQNGDLKTLLLTWRCLWFKLESIK